MRSSRTEPGGRRRGRPGRRTAGAVWTVLTVLLAAGCATMPDSGDPERVDPPQGAGADQGVQVRVIPVPPREGQSAREVLQNFLDASIADEHDYNTAKMYLTPAAAKGWHPDSGAVVLHDTNPGAPAVDPAYGSDDDSHVVIAVKSQETGLLDAGHSYTAVQNTPYEADFELVNVAKDGKDASARAQWRIATLPDGLILNQTNFRNAYQQSDRYFFTNPQPGGSDQPTVLVPDPIYLRRRVDPASAAAAALAQGPSDWLAPAVRTAFGGTSLVGSVNSDDPRNPRVQFSGVDFEKNAHQCQQMAAQLYFTLLSVAGAGSIDRVTLTAPHGGCDLTSGQAKISPYAPASLAGGPPGGAGDGQAYFRRPETGQLMRTTGPDSAAPVSGVLGAADLPAPLSPSGGHPVGPYAVRRDGRVAAVVSDDGKSLYEIGLDDGDNKLGNALATSQAPRSDEGFTSPSWDGFGGLWVVDRNPSAPRILLIRGQSQLTVAADLPTGKTVDGIRLSSDGTRIALLLKDPASGTRSLWVGVVVQGGTAAAPTATITGVRPIAPQLSDVSSVAWADSDLLLALGRESDSTQQLLYLATDGSPEVDSGLQAVDGMTVVAASEYRADPVLADSNNRTVYSLVGSTSALVGSAQWQWKAYGTDGVQPSYPG
ncbi:LpqB family beta-propeller domain-containing protein [Kitasatospora sp. NPDC052896]|uniref:LpqB family beta-propeller domain-containing protein n=1 Tax=Kitasatospora sp. NPDC052896 TaxID=3364061 RepID=UPI0037CCB273